MKKIPVYFLVFRYLFLALLALGNLFLISLVFTPLTVHSVFFILGQIYPGAQVFPNTFSSLSDVLLIGYEPSIWIKGYQATIISACVAVSAYYLLLILNFSTPLPLKKRIYSLFYLLSSFFLLNLARIVIFSIMFERGFRYFDIAHKLTWYLGSTILVISLWFSAVLIFKIKAIPVYTDMKVLFLDAFKVKKSRKK